MTVAELRRHEFYTGEQPRRLWEQCGVRLDSESTGYFTCGLPHEHDGQTHAHISYSGLVLETWTVQRDLEQHRKARRGIYQRLQEIGERLSSELDYAADEIRMLKEEAADIPFSTTLLDNLDYALGELSSADTYITDLYPHPEDWE